MHRVLLVQTGVRGELNISEGLSSGEGLNSGEGMGLIKASTGRTLLTPHSDPVGGFSYWSWRSYSALCKQFV